MTASQSGHPKATDPMATMRPATARSRLRSRFKLVLLLWWLPRQESNPRHRRPKRRALSTELQGNVLVTQTGFEPVIADLRGRCLDHLATAPLSMVE